MSLITIATGAASEVIEAEADAVRQVETDRASEGVVPEVSQESGTERAAEIAYDYGISYASMSDFERARPLLMEAVRLEPDNVRYLYAVGLISYELKNYTAARHYQLAVIYKLRQQQGEENERFVKLLDELAMIYIAEKNDLIAEILMKKTLQIRRTILGQNHHDTAINLSRLATVEMRLGDLGKAEHDLHQAIEIFEMADGNHDERIAGVLHNLGELYRLRKEFPKAEAAFRKALALWSIDPEKNSRQLTMTLKSLGAINTTTQQQHHGAPSSDETIL